MKLIKNFWNRLNQKNPEEMDKFIFAKLWREHDQIKLQLKRLEQDQYAKAHLDEYRRLEDRMLTVLKVFDENIEMIKSRLDKLETK